MEHFVKKESKGRNVSEGVDVQKNYLRSLVTESKMVNIIVKNGFQLRAFIEAFDDRDLIITKCENGVQARTKSMIYKSAISTIEPAR